MGAQKMQSAPDIQITRMEIGGFEVPVPQGLSDLLNTSGAWRVGDPDLNESKKYNRRVEMRGGELVTLLTKI